MRLTTIAPVLGPRLTRIFPRGTRALFVGAGLLLAAGAGRGESARSPNTAASIERPLRYLAVGTDMVIENGTMRFNRPLYGPRTGFRIDAGERPEFAFYAKGKSGVLWLGISTERGTRWLSAAQRIAARYRAGSMVYEIRDPLLGSGAMLRITALPLKDAEGLVLRAEMVNGKPLEVVWAFGGASGGSLNERGGDLIGGKDMGETWQIKETDFAGGNFTLKGGTFDYEAKAGAMAGAGTGVRLRLGDYSGRRTVDELIASKPDQMPVIVGRSPVRTGEPAYILVQKTNAIPPRPVDLRARFDTAEAARVELVKRLVVETPDAFVNAAAGAIAISADALWQPPQVMHGNIAWRSPLLGWRGPYALDVLGWFDRAQTQIENWAAKQNVDEKDVPATPHADPAKNLAADDWKMLHSFGSIPARHYDMNLVFIDMMLRHFRWTGDRALLRQMWPVLQRHLAWEKRLFDRGGTYEAYAAIWASDGLGYNGGGTTHATAYNQLHNTLAAQIARLLGEDPTPYDAEAKRIAESLRRDLWLPDRGWYAEYKELLGLKRPHPAAAAWTVYHAIDSEVADPFEAYQALRYVETAIPRIPLKGPGVPPGDWYALPSSTWQPYEWSLNNVVLAEMGHTALAYWQGGRGEEGWKLFKGALLDSMYLGSVPGNLANLSALDVNRHETYRDFGDPTGVMARSLVEGLFGIAPDALSGELAIRPGFPGEWDRASIRTPYLDYSFRRAGLTETFSLVPRFPVPLRLRLDVAAPGSHVRAVTINGQPATWANVDGAIGRPRIEIKAEPAERYDVEIRWGEEPVAKANYPAVVASGSSFRLDVGTAQLLEVRDPQGVLESTETATRGLRGKVAGREGHRTFFVKAKKDDLAWWMPVNVEIRPRLEVVALPRVDPFTAQFRVRNNTTQSWDGAVQVTYGHTPARVYFSARALKESAAIPVSGAGLFPGTNTVAFSLGEVGSLTQEIVNWELPLPTGSRAPAWVRVDLSALFNDQVGQIFKNEYLAPRSPFTSLSIPKQGIGNWSSNKATFEVDDRGLRKAAGAANEVRVSPGIPFQTPSAEGIKNVVFTSRWENYPAEVSVPLSGQASHLYLLMAGSTNPLQSQIDNGEVIVTYQDGTTKRLALANPANWWPIDQDYFIDDYAFRIGGTRPPRIELGTGKVYFPTNETKPQGGAATVLDLDLDPAKPLASLTVRTLSTEVVIGLMAATLGR